MAKVRGGGGRMWRFTSAVGLSENFLGALVAARLLRSDPFNSLDRLEQQEQGPCGDQ